MAKQPSSNDDGKRSASRSEEPSASRTKSAKTRSSGSSAGKKKATGTRKSAAKASAKSSGRANAKSSGKTPAKKTGKTKPAAVPRELPAEIPENLTASETALLGAVDVRLEALNERVRERLQHVESALFAQLAHLENQVGGTLHAVGDMVRDAMAGENVDEFLGAMGDVRDRLTAVLKKFDVPQSSFADLTASVAAIGAKQTALDKRVDGLVAVVEELAASVDRFQTVVIGRFDLLERR